MAVAYLRESISQVRRTETPRYGMTADGYTKKSGAPTSYLVRLEGQSRWRRVYCWQFSNAGTLFVRIGGVPLVVLESEIEQASQRTFLFFILVFLLEDFIVSKAGCMRISKKQFYVLGGFSNPDLFRQHTKSGWTYWVRIWAW